MATSEHPIESRLCPNTLVPHSDMCKYTSQTLSPFGSLPLTYGMAGVLKASGGSLRADVHP